MAYEMNGYIVLWSTETWRVVEHAPIQTAGMVSLSFSPDSKSLVTADDGGAVRLWEINPIREVATLGRHNGRVNSSQLHSRRMASRWRPLGMTRQSHYGMSEAGG